MATLVAAGVLGGCGTYVPGIAEAGDTESGILLQNAIVQSIHCELRNAVVGTIHDDKQGRERFAEFLEKWAVQLTLTLTIEEKTVVAPTIGMSFPPSLFTLGVGGNVSTGATRLNKLNYYYTIQELMALGVCSKGFTDQLTHPSGSLLIRSDLKTKEWLQGQVLNNLTGNFVETKNGFQHQVAFVVDTGGGVTPGAKLATVSLNPTGIFLTANRKRTHDLSLVFGPASAEEKQNKSLAPTAQAIFLSTQISAAIQAGLRGVVIVP
ncbi:MAG: hypothetical protein U1E85_00260 [Rhodocyclaceae bacterium]